MEDKRKNCPDYRNNIFNDEKIHLFEVILILCKYKKMILLLWLTGFAFSFGATLFMPDIYSATARAVPLQKKDSYFYANRLKGPAVADLIIEKFHLKESYRIESKSSLYQELKNRVSISVGKKDHIIYIKVEDTDPKRAAGMANAYVEELRKFSARKASVESAVLLQFLKERLAAVEKKLKQAEEKIKLFQEKHRPIRIDDQVKAAIETFARLKGELASKEIELGIALSGDSEQFSKETVLREWFVRLKSHIRELETSMVMGRTLFDYGNTNTTISEEGLQYARLLLDYRIQIELFELLSLQGEVAQIEEAKNGSLMQLLDAAFVPDKKEWAEKKPDCAFDYFYIWISCDAGRFRA